MSLSYRKSVSLGNNARVNVSKYGLSVTQRTSWGSYDSRGFSIRTGIPGLNFRSSFRGKNGSIVLLILAAIGLIYVGAVIIWNVLLLTWWIMLRLSEGGVIAIQWMRSKYLTYKASKQIPSYFPEQSYY